MGDSDDAAKDFGDAGLEHDVLVPSIEAIDYDDRLIAQELQEDQETTQEGLVVQMETVDPEEALLEEVARREAGAMTMGATQT